MHLRPFITVIVVARNEKKYIGNCLKSLFDQSYPKDRYEIVLVDSMSDDGSMDLVRRTYDDSGKVIKMRFFENPKKILATGWNIALKNTDSEYVVRIDAHTVVDKDFLTASMDTMLRVGDAVSVGGAMETCASSKSGEIVAKVITSPFGVGNSKFRYSKKAEYVDTVAFGLTKREIYDKVGYLDETLVRCQDNDLHRRIRESGGKFYLDPSIKVMYFAKDSIAKMLRQGFLNGKWTMITMRKSKRAILPRHLIPLAFLLGLMGTFILGLFFNAFTWIGVGVIAAHMLCGLIFAAIRTRHVGHILAMPFVFLAMHLCYGVGSVAGVVRPIKP